MTAPTQQLPSWLSVSTSFATNAAGEPTATFTTLIELPLTYYGPSIPLGTDGVWVYGGSSSPTAPSPTSSATTPTPFTPATPTSSALSSTPATPTTSALSSTTSSSLPPTLTLPSSATTSHTVPSSSSSSAPPSSTTSAAPVTGELSTHSTHTGVIVGSVLGSVLGSLLLLFLFICFLRKRQRNHQRRNRPTDPPTSQVLWMWDNVDRNDYDPDADIDAQLRSPGEGSPVASGDERDAFLRRSGDAPRGSRNGEPTARLVDAPRSSQDSSGRPIGIALTSGASVVASGSYGRKSKSPRMSSASDGARHVISREQLAEASGSPQSPDFPKAPEEAEPGPHSPLLPPPAFNLNVSHGSRKSLLNSERSMTPGNDPESALLYTAQRVRVGQDAVPSSSSGTSWPEAIGIPNILRRSWLSPKPRSTTPTTPSTKSSQLLTRQLTDNELELGRSINAQLRTEMGYRDDARPLSGVSGLSTGSARSGNTVFYDTQSREDVASTPPPVPPLPQGTTSTGRTGPGAPSPLSGEPIRAPDDGEGPPAYEPPVPGSYKTNELADYLDIPVPRPASPFASVSSAKALSPPPGLALQNSHEWRDSAATALNTSGGVDSGIDIDLLEEAPPAAGESWRQLAATQGLPTLHERRTTFGLPMTLIHPRDLTTSEQGSLHSMRSHLSPHSALSAAGSAPVSNSASEHSRGFTINSLKSLAHSSSISSTDRRLVRPSPGEVSPALSALGRHPHRAVAGPPPVSATVTSNTTTRSSVTTHTSVTDPVTGDVTRVAHAAWTGGRERERESPVPVAELGAWGEGGWSSPTHLRILQKRVAGRDGASHA
ncbi:hypothetical protein EI94DRAFT_887246 [Lactarius quietus]|nr:hypothetical protein EI94DRAFT_887246 [Lactarius quietus]